MDLRLGFETWIWDLDLGLGFVTGLGLDNFTGILWVTALRDSFLCWIVRLVGLVKSRFKFMSIKALN